MFKKFALIAAPSAASLAHAAPSDDAKATLAWIG